MRVDFMDITTGEVYATASAVTTRNGKLVPDSLGLPVLFEDSPCCCDNCFRRSECYDPDTLACARFE